MRKTVLLFLPFAAAALAAAPGQAPRVGTDTNRLPLATPRSISFTTDEGTWISVDVSPDGRSIVFDLVGDIYLLPIGGGEARRLTSGAAWDAQPTFSPDGREIAFVSDRSGNHNVWTVRVDGAGLEMVTKETDALLFSPEWTPDGQYLAVRRGGQMPLAMVHRKIGRNVPLNVGAAGSGVSFAPDGRTLYFSARPPGGFGAGFQGQQLISVDRSTGKRDQLTSIYGGAVRPIISPDGRYLVYVSRQDATTALRIRDLTTRKEEWLVASVQRDEQEGRGASDYFPRYSFTPDSRAVVFTADGKIKRVDIASKQVSVIPFSARVDIPTAAPLKVKYRVAQDDVDVRQMYWMNRSPDGKQVAFSAVGKAWVADLATGRARRLTSSTLREFSPVFSPDGRWIAFISSSDSAGATIVKMPSGGGAPVNVTEAGGNYKTIGWSPRSDKIVYMGRHIAVDDCLTCDEYAWFSANGGESHFIAKSSRSWYAHGEAHLSVIETPQGGERLYLSENADGGTVVASIKLDGTDRRVHARFGGAAESGIGAPSFDIGAVVPSPDGRWILFTDYTLPYLAELPEVGAPLTVNLAAAAVPLRKLTELGAYSVGWADSGRTITWSFTNRLYQVPLDDALRAESTAVIRPRESIISLAVPRAKPKGKVYLSGARIITMKGDEVIENGAILIEDNRIAAIGPASRVPRPADAKLIDVRGKTIMPGLVDVHSEPLLYPAIAPQEEWETASYLAFGVTTLRQPFASRVLFWWSELVESGEITGPRIYAVGRGLTTSAAPIKNYRDAYNIVRRYQLMGATSLKQYAQPRRIQRQWMRMAADSLGINVTNEGLGDLATDMTFAIDGMTGTEHALPTVPIYRDIVQLLAQSGITYTPTLIVTGGAGESAERYWFNKFDLHSDAKTRRFTPHAGVDQEFRRRTIVVDDDYILPLVAQGVRDVVRAGGRAGLGSHGATIGGGGGQHGLGAQWEIWALASGGMTPLETIRVATLFGAQSIGLDQDIGSLEAGKMADLLVLDANPLDDIRNTNKIRYVVKNGVVRDGDTLDEVWPGTRKFPLFRWTVEDAAFEALKRIKK